MFYQRICDEISFPSGNRLFHPTDPPSLTRNRWILHESAVTRGRFFFKIAATNPTAYLLDYEISSVVDTVDSRARVSSMTGTLLFSMRDDIYIFSLFCWRICNEAGEKIYIINILVEKKTKIIWPHWNLFFLFPFLYYIYNIYKNIKQQIATIILSFLILSTRERKKGTNRRKIEID